MRSKRPVREFDTAPALALVGSVAQFSELVGVSRTQTYRWIDAGLTAIEADEVAISLGVHPSELWVEWLTVVPEPQLSLDLDLL